MKNKMKRILLEEILPFAMSTAAVLVWWLTDFVVPESLDGIISAGLSFASISGGFLVTAWAVIISAGDKRLIKKLFESTVFYSRFNRFFRHSVYAMLSLTFLSMIGFFIQLCYRAFFMAGFIFIFVLSASLAFRFGYAVYCVVNSALLDSFKQSK